MRGNFINHFFGCPWQFSKLFFNNV
jgi:hypothetical protein